MHVGTIHTECKTKCDLLVTVGTKLARSLHRSSRLLDKAVMSHEYLLLHNLEGLVCLHGQSLHTLFTDLTLFTDCLHRLSLQTDWTFQLVYNKKETQVT